jgi:hypothetical protein
MANVLNTDKQIAVIAVLRAAIMQEFRNASAEEA